MMERWTSERVQRAKPFKIWLDNVVGLATAEIQFSLVYNVQVVPGLAYEEDGQGDVKVSFCQVFQFLCLRPKIFYSMSLLFL